MDTADSAGYPATQGFADCLGIVDSVVYLVIRGSVAFLDIADFLGRQ